MKKWLLTSMAICVIMITTTASSSEAAFKFRPKFSLKINTSIANFGTKSSVKIKNLSATPFEVYEKRLLVIVSVPESFKLYKTGLRKMVFYRSFDGTDGVKVKGEFYPIAGIDPRKGIIFKHMDPTEFKHSLLYTLGNAYHRQTSEQFINYLVPERKPLFSHKNSALP